jgi:hypothetical protein
MMTMSGDEDVEGRGGGSDRAGHVKMIHNTHANDPVDPLEGNIAAQPRALQTVPHTAGSQKTNNEPQACENWSENIMPPNSNQTIQIKSNDAARTEKNKRTEGHIIR